MKNVKLIFVAISFAFIYACGGNSNQSQSQDIDWTGTYSYHEIGGPGLGGEPREWNYYITIVKNNDGYSADYNIDGYQTMSRVKCTAKEENGKLAVYFLAYGEDHMGPGFTEDNDKPILTITPAEDGTFIVDDGELITYKKETKK